MINYNAPIIELMEAAQWEKALSSSASCLCSDEHFDDYFFSLNHNPSIESVACMIKIGRLPYIQDLMDNYETSIKIKGSSYLHHIIEQLFHIEIMPIVMRFCPIYFDDLVKFQIDNFHPSFFQQPNGSVSFVVARFLKLSHEQKLFTLNSIITLLDFINKNISAFNPNSYNPIFVKTFCFSIIQAVVLSYTSREQFIRCCNLILSLNSNSLDDPFSKIYLYLENQISLTSTEFREDLSEYLILIFQQPVLCSIAFKDNSQLFLPYCNVQDSIGTDPHLFF